MDSDFWIIAEMVSLNYSVRSPSSQDRLPTRRLEALSSEKQYTDQHLRVSLKQSNLWISRLGLFCDFEELLLGHVLSSWRAEDVQKEPILRSDYPDLMLLIGFYPVDHSFVHNFSLLSGYEFCSPTKADAHLFMRMTMWRDSFSGWDLNEKEGHVFAVEQHARGHILKELVSGLFFIL
jgi:hypothetical protein